MASAFGIPKNRAWHVQISEPQAEEIGQHVGLSEDNFFFFWSQTNTNNYSLTDF